MRPRGRAVRLLATTAAAALLAGCAVARIENGVFHSPRGYRVTLPGPEWRVSEESSAELELRHRTLPAGMVANAVCEPAAVRQRFGVLTRHLLVGLRDRAVLEEGEVAVRGLTAAHTLVEGRPDPGVDRVRVEAFVVKDARCVYDLLYVAHVRAFEAGRRDFRRLVESFATE